MKRFNHILRCAIALVFLLLTNGVTAQSSDAAQPSRLDSLDVSLLTCGQRQEVYALYGHTAIRLHDRATGSDVAVNYGIFSFKKSFFILRFIFGQTDYEMGIESFEHFMREYADYGESVVQQKLNLTRQEKQTLLAALEENYRPENRVYRYNFFYDNCTTRARDILVAAIDGTVRYANRVDEAKTFRSMIHTCANDFRWVSFGNDLLLGVGSDLRTDRAKQQFLPANLEADFDDAVIVAKDGTKRKLVVETTQLLDENLRDRLPSFPLTPTELFLIFAVIVVAVSIFERVKNKMFWGIDAVLMTVSGLCGVILFMMIFSQHPTVRVNFQILLLNPLNLVFVIPTIKKMCQRRVHFWLPLYSALLVLFLIGGFFQCYAEGVWIVALSLLVRNVIKIDQIVRTK